MSKNLTILIGVLIILILGLGGWYFFSQSQFPKPFQPKKSVLQQIQEQEQAQGFVKETRLIIGRITAVQGNTLTIESKIPEVDNPSRNINALQNPTTRKIIIGGKTILNKIISLPKGRQGDSMIYSTAMVKIKPEDLKVGGIIEVYADEDIKYKEEITPIEIRLQ